MKTPTKEEKLRFQHEHLTMELQILQSSLTEPQSSEELLETLNLMTEREERLNKIELEINRTRKTMSKMI
jgi:hypothetical protein